METVPNPIAINVIQVAAAFVAELQKLPAALKVYTEMITKFKGSSLKEFCYDFHLKTDDNKELNWEFAKRKVVISAFLHEEKFLNVKFCDIREELDTDDVNVVYEPYTLDMVTGPESHWDFAKISYDVIRYLRTGSTPMMDASTILPEEKVEADKVNPPPRIAQLVDQLNTQWLVGSDSIVTAYLASDEWGDDWKLRLFDKKHDRLITEHLSTDYVYGHNFYLLLTASREAFEAGVKEGYANYVEQSVRQLCCDIKISPEVMAARLLIPTKR